MDGAGPLGLRIRHAISQGSGLAELGRNSEMQCLGFQAYLGVEKCWEQESWSALHDGFTRKTNRNTKRR